MTREEIPQFKTLEEEKAYWESKGPFGIEAQREEIREGIAQRLYWSAYVGGDWDTAVQQELYRAKAKKVFEYLHSQGLKLPNGESLVGGDSEL